MIRAIPFLVLMLVGAVVVAVRPDLPLRWAARFWPRIVLRHYPGASVPEWVSHYLWGALGDPVPRSVSTFEDSLRLVAILVLAGPAVLLFLILLT